MTTTRTYTDTRIDTKLILSGLWIVMLFVFAYVDIFGFFRSDVLSAALDGRVATTDFGVDQVFLSLTLLYILIPSLMVILSLVLKPRANRIANIVVGVIYAISIIVACIGVGWIYYIAGSIVEVVMLVALVRTASTWPAR